MTTKPRTLEEIAEATAHECALSGPDYMYQGLKALYKKLILAALREAADGAFEDAPNWCSSGHPIVRYGTSICPVCVTTDVFDGGLGSAY